MSAALPRKSVASGFSDEEFSTSGAGSTDSSSISDSVSLTLSPTFSLISSEDSTCVVSGNASFNCF